MKFTQLILFSLIASSAYTKSVSLVKNDVVTCDHESKDGDLFETNHLINSSKTFNATNTTCDICDFFVSIVKNDIDSGNHIIKNITNFIEYICEHINGPAAQECDNIVKNISVIVNYLDHGMNITQVCNKLGFCNSTMIF